MRRQPALLVTADGEVFRGSSVGAEGMTTGEAVFNTSMTGYQEILTDPSYAGQVVVMTSPHIGNYGTNGSDDQSAAPAVAGLVVRSLSRRHSNWRAEGSLAETLLENGVVAMSEVDTRRLTRHIRDRGAMPVALGVGTTEAELADAAAAAPVMDGLDLASTVTTAEPYRVAATGEATGLIVAIDLGLKRDILTQLTQRGFEVEVVPASTSATRILDSHPVGVFVSNGPGDPEAVPGATERIRGLSDAGMPIFGICLGHQLIARAFGGSNYKLPYGHRGGNHPVLNYETGAVEITSQNHGFAVEERDGEILGAPELEVTHRNLNDGTVEGLKHRSRPVFAVQYHPESAPGPHDSRYLFNRFVATMAEVAS